MIQKFHDVKIYKDDVKSAYEMQELKSERQIICMFVNARQLLIIRLLGQRERKRKRARKRKLPSYYGNSVVQRILE